MDILNDQAWLLTIVLQKRYNESNNFKKNKDVLYNSGHSVQLRKKKKYTTVCRRMQISSLWIKLHPWISFSWIKKGRVHRLLRLRCVNCSR